MSAVTDRDAPADHRGQLYTLKTTRTILGERHDEFVRDVAAGAVPSSLAAWEDAHTSVVVSAGAVSDWLGGRLPAAVSPARRSKGEVAQIGDAGPVLACLGAHVARWHYQDRIDAGVAADLEHYLQRIRESTEALENELDRRRHEAPRTRRGKGHSLSSPCRLEDHGQCPKAGADQSRLPRAFWLCGCSCHVIETVPL